MFTELYLNTTNPKTSLLQMMQQNIVPIIISVLFHTLVYAAAANIASYIFTGKYLSVGINTRLLTILLFIMFFGYIGRYYHVQDVYNAYAENMEKTRNHLDRLYIGWIFIA
jgi:hypothetical protein